MPDDIRLLTGDCLHWLRQIKPDSIDCCVTSPPYFGLRDYGMGGQIGLEQTPADYVAKLVEVFSEVRRILKPDGTFWLNLGDSYARAPTKGGSGPNGKNEERWGYGDANKARVKDPNSKQATNRADDLDHVRKFRPGSGRADGVVDTRGQRNRNGVGPVPGLKEKDLIGIPWRVAFALQADGWYLRQDIIWHKPNPMPESVRDRCTKAHEYVFMLSKSQRYYYDFEAIEEQRTSDESRPTFRGGAYINNSTFNNSEGGNSTVVGNVKFDKQAGHGRKHAGFNERCPTAEQHGSVKTTRNKRSVWTVAPKPFKEAHFATFPPDLIRPCILAGCRKGGIVLDPFGGAGTTALVAREHGRKAVLIELNPAYVEIAQRRLYPEMQQAAE